MELWRWQVNASMVNIPLHANKDAGGEESVPGAACSAFVSEILPLAKWTAISGKPFPATGPDLCMHQ